MIIINNIKELQIILAIFTSFFLSIMIIGHNVEINALMDPIVIKPVGASVTNVM